MILSWHVSRHIQSQVEQLLTKSAGAPVSLQFARFIRYPSVCRLLVQASPLELGGSVIVKGVRRRANHSASQASYPAPQWMFFNDWAGLQFLEQEALEAGCSPRLYAAEREPALLIIEDLNPLAHLGTYLDGTDAHEAEEALAQWGTALGKLHASTIGKQATFDAMRDTLAPRVPSWGWVSPWQRAPAVYHRLVESVPAAIREQGFESFQWMLFTLRQVCAFLALPLSSQTEAELECVVRALSSPGPFLAYTHGDPCSENCLFTQQGLKFVDFENGAYRHALFDAVYPRMCFPTCWHAKQIPLQVAVKTEQHYRDTLVAGCPEAADERLFAQALVHACAYWALLPCQFNALSRLTAKDRAWCPTRLQIKMQQRIIVRFERLAQTTTETGYLERLGSLFQTLVAALRKRWPTQAYQLPFYSAFKNQ